MTGLFGTRKGKSGRSSVEISSRCLRCGAISALAKHHVIPRAKIRNLGKIIERQSLLGGGKVARATSATLLKHMLAEWERNWVIPICLNCHRREIPSLQNISDGAGDFLIGAIKEFDGRQLSGMADKTFAHGQNQLAAFLYLYAAFRVDSQSSSEVRKNLDAWLLAIATIRDVTTLATKFAQLERSRLSTMRLVRLANAWMHTPYVHIAKDYLAEVDRKAFRSPSDRASFERRVGMLLPLSDAPERAMKYANEEGNEYSHNTARSILAISYLHRGNIDNANSEVATLVKCAPSIYQRV